MRRSASPLARTLGLALLLAALAAGTGLAGPQTELTSLHGRVLGPDGAPQAGAVVVSDHGERALTDADGAYVLALELPLGTPDVALTAVGAGSQLAQARVPSPRGGGAVFADPLVLSMGSECLPDWLPTFGAAQGVDLTVYALAVFDDGNGPALYVSGEFDQAGGIDAEHIARWDGVGWSPLGAGLAGPANALAVFDDGTGPALYAGGSFSSAGGAPARRLARWDGAAWSTLDAGGTDGSDGPVHSLGVHFDGFRDALYVGGEFDEAGGVAARNIAKWNGIGFTPLGAGLNGQVHAITSFDDGGGADLYAGGSFTLAGGHVVLRVARWDDGWTPVGTGFDSTVTSLAVFDDGNGEALYAGGFFDQAGPVNTDHLARWDGAQWSEVGGGTNVFVTTLAVVDDGNGPALFVGGPFTTAGGMPASHAARWDGSAWSYLAGGLSSDPNAFCEFDEGGGPALFAGGVFQEAGGVPVSFVARWDGAQWSTLGGGLDDGVQSLAVYDDGAGQGPMLYVAGDFDSAGGLPAYGIARWNGGTWSTVGSGLDGGIVAMGVYDDGGGAKLFVGGTFSSIDGVPASRLACYDGTSWSALGSGADHNVLGMGVFDGALYVGGIFSSIDGVASPGVARYDGSSWSSPGGGLAETGNGPLPSATAFGVFDDGNGPALYAGGSFTHAGGVPAASIARWDGASWSPLGAGILGRANDMAVLDDGNGLALIVGGDMVTAGGLAVNRMARWDGASWSAVGQGLNGRVQALSLFDDQTGNGAELFAAGWFTASGGTPANRVARWDGSEWHALKQGMSSSVFAMEVYTPPSGGGPGLIVGGEFSSSPGGDSYLARWGGCDQPPVGVPYCFGDGQGSACPCANAGGTGEGCANSTGAGGELATAGSTSVTADDLLFLAGQLVPGQPALLFSGANELNGGDGIPFGDGLRCAGAGVLRHGTRTPDGGGNASWGPGLATPAGWQPGDLRRFQAWYRDPAGPCSSGFNLSQGMRVVFTP